MVHFEAGDGIVRNGFGEPGFAKMQESVTTIAQLLEQQTAIPAVAAKLLLIQEVQSAEFWEGVTVLCLEQVRKGLRDLVGPDREA